MRPATIAIKAAHARYVLAEPGRAVLPVLLRER
jgi:hypothetical protein